MEKNAPQPRIYQKTVPREMRMEAIKAIKTGDGLEAVARANAVADEINKISFYEAQVRAHIVAPYELI